MQKFVFAYNGICRNNASPVRLVKEIASKQIWVKHLGVERCNEQQFSQVLRMPQSPKAPGEWAAWPRPGNIVRAIGVAARAQHFTAIMPTTIMCSTFDCGSGYNVQIWIATAFSTTH